MGPSLARIIPQLLFVVVVLALTACGTGGDDTSEGFITDDNICRVSDESVATDIDAPADETFAPLAGTLGLQARLGKLLPARDMKIWGVRLHMKAGSDVVARIIVPTSVVLETGSSLGEATFENPGEADGAWAVAEFKEPIVFAARADAWLFLYGEGAEKTSVDIGVREGAGFNAFDETLGRWVSTPDRELSADLVECL